MDLNESRDNEERQLSCDVMQATSLEHENHLDVQSSAQSSKQDHDLHQTDFQKYTEDHATLLVRKAAMKWLIYCLRKRDLKTTGSRVYLGMEEEEEFYFEEYVDKIPNAARVSNRSLVTLSNSSSSAEEIIPPNEREELLTEKKIAENALQNVKDERDGFESLCMENMKKIEAFEQEVQLLSKENMEWQEKIGHLLVENKSLHRELKEMQDLLEKARQPAVHFIHATTKSDSTLWPTMSTLVEIQESLDTALDVENATISQLPTTLPLATSDAAASAMVVGGPGVSTPPVNFHDFPSFSEDCRSSLASLNDWEKSEVFIMDEEIPETYSDDELISNSSSVSGTSHPSPALRWSFIHSSSTSSSVSTSSSSCLISAFFPYPFAQSSNTSARDSPAPPSTNSQVGSAVPLLAAALPIAKIRHWIYYITMGLTYPFLPITLPMVNWVVHLQWRLLSSIASRFN